MAALLSARPQRNFPGRFAALKASLHTIYVQPNVSYAISDDWSVGIGPVFGFSNVELIQSVDLSQQKTPAGPTFGQLGIPKRTEFARATLKGNANAFGVNLGVHGRINTSWEVGARFLSQMLTAVYVTTIRYWRQDTVFDMELEFARAAAFIAEAVAPR